MDFVEVSPRREVILIMNDLQKLKYDLAMNCAMVDTLVERQEKGANINTRDTMFENFISYYEFYCMMDQSHFYKFIVSLPELEKLAPR